jgi:hypothetical protein
MSIPITPLYLDRPCVGSYDSQDVRDVLIPLNQILGSMAVVLWPGPEIRYRAPTALLYNGSDRASDAGFICKPIIMF